MARDAIQAALDRGDNVVLITRASEIPKASIAKWFRNPEPEPGPFPNNWKWQERWSEGIRRMPKHRG